MVKTGEGGDKANTQRFEAVDVSDYGEEAFLKANCQSRRCGEPRGEAYEDWFELADTVAAIVEIEVAAGAVGFGRADGTFKDVRG